MNSTSKIARLPRDLRIKLNRRLDNGLPSHEILAWLNSDKTVRKILAEQFDSEPISRQNLSSWRTGGYQEWTNRRDALELAREISSDADEDLSFLSQGQDGNPGFSDKMSLWFSIRYLVLAKKVMVESEKGDLDKQEAAMHRIGRELAHLRRADHSAARIRLQRERFEFQKTQTEEAKEAREAKSKPAKPKAPDPFQAEKMHRVCQLLFGENVSPSPAYMKTEKYKKEQEEREKRQAATSPDKVPQSNSDAPEVQNPSPSEPQIPKPEHTSPPTPPQPKTWNPEPGPIRETGGVLGDQHDPTKNTARDRNSVDFTDPYGIKASASKSRRRNSFF